MAGAGFKTFVAGAVLGATEINTYLMPQSVMVFASALARDTTPATRIATPSQGMVSYLSDEGRTYTYTGGSWKPNTPFTIESGSFSVTGNQAQNFTASRFSQTPIVVVTVQSGNNTGTSVTTVSNSTTGFTAYVWSGTAAATAAKTVHWVAIQALSGNATG
jgi:hypothetical protein